MCFKRGRGLSLEICRFVMQEPIPYPTLAKIFPMPSILREMLSKMKSCSWVKSTTKVMTYALITLLVMPASSAIFIVVSLWGIQECN